MFKQSMLRLFLTLTISSLAYSALAFDTLNIDLSKRWQTYEGGVYRKFSGEGNAVHFTVEVSDEGILEIFGKRKISVLLNNRLVSMNGNKIKWAIDSLRMSNSLPLRISIYSSSGADNIISRILTVHSDKYVKDGTSSFRHIILLLSFALVLFLLILIRAYPQSVRDYFNFFKLFSVRATDDGAVTVRATSINNVLINIFCTVLIAFNILILMFGGKDAGGNGYMFNFFSAAVIILGLLTAKIIIVISAAWFFRLTVFAPGQFYNFIRLLLVGFGLHSAWLLSSFMLGLESNFAVWSLGYFLAIYLSVFLTSTFFKLTTVGGFTGFHLFSYLCASEIIPLLILLNVFFF